MFAVGDKPLFDLEDPLTRKDGDDLKPDTAKPPEVLDILNLSHI